MIRAFQAFSCVPSLIPALALRNATEPIVSCLRISDFPCQRTIGLAWLQEHYLTASVRLFRQFVIEYFVSLPTS